MCSYYYRCVKLLPFFLLIRTFNLSIATWILSLSQEKHFLFKPPAFLACRWVRGPSALGSLRVLFINSGPQNLDGGATVPKARSGCSLWFGGMCWGSLHAVTLHFFLFASDSLLRFSSLAVMVKSIHFPRASLQHFPPVVHSGTACGQVSKEPHLHMVLLDNPLSTIFSSHSVAFLPVATFLSLHQLAQWFIQQASSLEVMVHN